MRVDGNGLLKGRQASGREGRATRVSRLSSPRGGWMVERSNAGRRGGGRGLVRERERAENGDQEGGLAERRRAWERTVTGTGEEVAVMVERTGDRVNWRLPTEVASGNHGASTRLNSGGSAQFTVPSSGTADREKKKKRENNPPPTRLKLCNHQEIWASGSGLGTGLDLMLREGYRFGLTGPSYSIASSLTFDSSIHARPEICQQPASRPASLHQRLDSLQRRYRHPQEAGSGLTGAGAQADQEVDHTQAISHA
ncbi:uncharacterized protein IWZ02DRAFT_125260 [Phyllosticta citriasiana]|uniref:uncharacterized protein n=1 Tax=Phyllosticta citriasiana TaxID=595635 RepID=UPI0030FD7CC7